MKSINTTSWVIIQVEILHSEKIGMLKNTIVYISKWCSG